MSGEFDTAVLGAGVAGASVAFGLARAGHKVCLIDEGDVAHRAARGNFGLVWVQGKGVGNPAYARWSMAAAQAWPAFAAGLRDCTGIDVELSQPGGLAICIEEAELRRRVDGLRSLREAVGESYAFEVLDAAGLQALVPRAGKDVAGAIWSPLDGHVSPLKLLRALLEGCQRLGAHLSAGAKVRAIEPQAGGGFVTRTAAGAIGSARVVLAAGLGNRTLAPMVALQAPVVPVRGQILVSERMQPFLRLPTLHVRQTEEGVVQIGDSKEDAGFDDGTTIEELARIAARAVRCFPCLRDVRIVRTWGALRVMSPDGLPIYEASSQCPGAYLVTCHSGITLAPQHAGALADWIRGAPIAPEAAGFTAGRFDVQAH